MSSKIYGYARTSTLEQCIDRQIALLTDYGVVEDNIIQDNATGRHFNREGYFNLKNYMLRAGDTLVITELDRLGRDFTMLKKEWQEIQNMAVDIVVLDMPLLNTKGKTSLEKTLIVNLAFEIMAYMSEKERLKNRERQAQGIQALRDRNGGKAIGRPKIEMPKNFGRIYDQWKTGEITAVKAMQKLKLKKSTFYKFVKEYEELLEEVE